MACSFPVTIKNPAFKIDRGASFYIPVPCGTCPTCLNRRINSWMFRLLQEDKVAKTAYFITLTYGTNDKPGFIESPNGLNTLTKSHLQNFFKRLRNTYRYRAVNPDTGRMRYMYDKVPDIKYFAVGEYGSRRQRPHYHAIIFNTDVSRIEKAWVDGTVHVGSVTGASIAYTLKYMHKGKTVPRFELDDRVQEFQLHSQGLGKSYLTPAVISYHQQRVKELYVTLPGGVKMPMPRYYRAKIYTDAQRKAQARFAQRMANDLIEKKQADYINQYGTLDGYYAREVERKRAYLDIFRARSKSRDLQF